MNPEKFANELSYLLGIACGRNVYSANLRKSHLLLSLIREVSLSFVTEPSSEDRFGFCKLCGDMLFLQRTEIKSSMSF